MNSLTSRRRARPAVASLLALLLLLLSGPSRAVLAQTLKAAPDAITSPAHTTPPLFRLERTSVAGGAELLTVFACLPGIASETQTNETSAQQTADVPLVTILRDTLGDEWRENDRLRYVWMHTYARPGTGQRLAAAVPFLYNRVGNRHSLPKQAPPPVIDLAATDHEVWQKLFWSALQTMLLDPYGFTIKAPTRTYRRNLSDYRQAHIIRALAVLSLYEATTDGQARVFTPDELSEIQARLMLTDKTFGGIIDDIRLPHTYQQQTVKQLDERGHNWELLRQQAEANGLIFEPLQLPDGSATHALLWLARGDLTANAARKLQGRFLNIANPWSDARLRRWQGYTETRYFDADNRPVAADTPGAHAVELIPLALYGLDHPKIPILLVDFRSALNPKGRELSKRTLDDVARNVLALSHFDLPYLLGRTVYDYVTGKRGMDVNQGSRLRAYSELKLLLALDASLAPEFRHEINERVEHVSLNPLENDAAAEARLAQAQYAALLAYARRPDGLPAQLDRDRRAELVAVKHTRTEQTLFRLANILSFGLYTHREQASAAAQATALDESRQLAYHRRFIREVAQTSARVEVQWRVADVLRSLEYLAAHGTRADSKTAAAVERIFMHTQEADIQRLCLSSLYRIDNETAKAALARIYRDEAQDARWRALSAEYLRRAAREDQHIAPATAKVIAELGGQ